MATKSALAWTGTVTWIAQGPVMKTTVLSKSSSSQYPATHEGSGVGVGGWDDPDEEGDDK